MIITLCRRGTLKNIRFVLRIEHFVLRMIDAYDAASDAESEAEYEDY